MEEDITSMEAHDDAQPQTPSEATVQAPKIVRPEKRQLSAAIQKKEILQPLKHGKSHSHQSTTDSSAKRTEQPQLGSAKSAKKQRQSENRQPKNRPRDDWLVKITSDGTAIYANSRDQRYYFDAHGNKVYLRQSP
jgi:hypothetical protein